MYTVGLGIQAMNPASRLKRMANLGALCLAIRCARQQAVSSKAPFSAIITSKGGLPPSVQ
jgi:hypothetical protein